MIKVSHLHKAVKKIIAVDDVSFSAPDGQITSLRGPTCAGKTTTLRILYTVYQADRGTATVDGFDAAESPREVQTRIGVLPDNVGLYPRLTSREHIRYFGRLLDLPPAEVERSTD